MEVKAESSGKDYACGRVEAKRKACEENAGMTFFLCFLFGIRLFILISGHSL
jgi:hypothetical protein